MLCLGGSASGDDNYKGFPFSLTGSLSSSLRLVCHPESPIRTSHQSALWGLLNGLLNGLLGLHCRNCCAWACGLGLGSGAEDPKTEAKSWTRKKRQSLLSLSPVLPHPLL